MKGMGSAGLLLKTVYRAGTTPARMSSMATTGLRARCHTTLADAAAGQPTPSQPTMHHAFK